MQVLFRELTITKVFQELALVFDLKQIPNSLGRKLAVSEVNESADGIFFRSAVVHLPE